MIENNKRTLAPIEKFVQEGKGFSYGAAFAQKLEPAQFNKSARVMVRKVGEIASVLNLPLSIPQSPSVISHNNGNSFVQVTSDKEDFYIMGRTPINGKEIGELHLDKDTMYTLITGSCLFSANSVRAVAADGDEFFFTNPLNPITKPIESIEIKPSLSLYEAETIARLSQLIGTVSRSDRVQNLFLGLPQVEYYLYALDSYIQGFFSANQMTSWIQAVDMRREKLTASIKKRVTASGGNKELTFVDVLPLDPIKIYLMDAVKQRDVPSMEVAQKLLQESHPLWKDLLSINPPGEWKDFNMSSYIFAYLSAGLPKIDERKNVGIAIDNPIESKIFAHAKRIVPQLQQSLHDYNLVALYPHELVLPLGENADKTMYHIKENGARLDDMKEIVCTYNNNRKRR